MPSSESPEIAKWRDETLSQLLLVMRGEDTNHWQERALKAEEELRAYLRNPRGTGRTTRMLQEAREAYDKGQEVYIVTLNRNMAGICRSEVGSRCRSGTPQQASQALRGCRGVAVFIDHAVTEQFHLTDEFRTTLALASRP